MMALDKFEATFPTDLLMVARWQDPKLALLAAN
jgi:hypothetical protein